MAVGRKVWDPFAGTLPFERQHVAEPGEGVKLPGWVNTVFGLLAIAASIAIVIAFFWRPAAWFGVPALVVSVVGLFGGDLLARTAARRDRLFFRLAEKNDWGFRLIEPQMRPRKGTRRRRPVDPFAARVYQTIPDLCRPRAGQLIPLQLQAMYWGDTEAKIPFWLGLQQYEVDATIAVETIRKDGFGGRGLQGKLFNMVVAYDLERDTGIRAHLLAEAFDRDGWRDIKTESVEFNDRFNISIADDRVGDGGQLALLRALTPATQSMLIDLHDRYQAQLIIDGATVYFAGNDRIMSDEDEVVAARFGALVEQFAEAAVSFKRFVE
ncbi:hypothetical protein EJC49_14300 [Aquibium carbonis]|uniref:DUF3137 domain-containing protein n=1 Tax=Aquibium carbonis TaxID=2495581 RepID=A0A3S0A679_9HYPH|nr:hypothetical protein [Aquibium carbonis]RST85707.1 hypothetical protein EJC49_14300 [Aquibium carbonis]